MGQNARKLAGLLAGPLLFILLYNAPFTMISVEADQVLAMAAWMILWWITEAVSISVTALIPLTLFPVFGIMDMTKVAASYGHPIVFLFFGGFVMALGLEKVGLHRRIALNIVRLTGRSPNRVILGFMLATAFLSMWISNTATTVVMLPIALSVIELLTKETKQEDANFSLSLMLSIAYAANVGGIATIIGTPPNTILVGFLEKEYQLEVGFLEWMLLGIPFSAIMIFIIYFVLVRLIYPNQMPALENSARLIEKELEALGPIGPREKRVLIIFASAIFLWISRRYINAFLPIELSDTGISLLAAMALFVWPHTISQVQVVLEWEDTRRLPWGILILFGGGLALAGSFSDSGIIDYIGAIVSSQQGIQPMVVAITLITVVLFMTELMSNVALVAVFAPVVAGIALGLEEDILGFLIPVTMASSCAFMLPMATPPNATVFASGYIKVNQMVRAGALLNVISIVLLILFSLFVIPHIFD